jgi:uncharacterized RmlC-like cupin family protein
MSAGLRIGSIEMVAAFAAFALIAIAPRARRTQAGSFGVVRIELDVAEPSGFRRCEGACPLVVGRSSGADLMVLDPEVSRRHARFETQSGVVYVSDLGSSNGTFLNGKRLDGVVEVLPGDRIDVGTTRITFVAKKSLANGDA